MTCPRFRTDFSGVGMAYPGFRADFPEIRIPCPRFRADFPGVGMAYPGFRADFTPVGDDILANECIYTQT